MESKESLQKEADALTSELLSLNSELKDLHISTQSSISDLTLRADAIQNLLGSIRSVDQIIGRRYPKWYMVEIPFEFGASTPKAGTIEISANPFICTQLQTSYLITDTDSSHFPYSNFDITTGIGLFADVNSAGRSLPCSAYYNVIASLLYGWTQGVNSSDIPWAAASDWPCLGEQFSSYGTHPTLKRYSGWNYPEFDFEISIVGSGRHWTQNKIPAPAFFGREAPFYLAYEGIVEASDRIEVKAHPVTDTINTTGMVRFVFFGYEIETDIRLSDIFGY